MKILVVEDTESIAHMIEALVRAKGHSVIAVGNGPKAVEAARNDGPFDVILLDINLPGGLDGFEVCKRLRAEPLAVTSDIYFISAMSEPEFQTKATEVGATGFFAKPFSPLALLRELEKRKK
jgi:CheY-like chemotaxis protein